MEALDNGLLTQEIICLYSLVLECARSDLMMNDWDALFTLMMNDWDALFTLMTI